MTRQILRSDAITLCLKILPHGEGLELPAYQSEHASGLDILAAISEDNPIILRPTERALIPTGLAIELPPGYEGQVRPRSGLAAKHGVTVLNTPGTIDADYRGEVKVILINFGQEPFTISRGMRIAQLVIHPVIQVKLDVICQLSKTDRAASGFGSTGLATAKP